MLSSGSPIPTRVRLRTILWSALGLLLFSLSFTYRDDHGWQREGEYHLRMERILAGAPLPWANYTWSGYTWFQDKSARPSLATLPGGDDWTPGVRIEPEALWIAMATALALATAIVFATNWARNRLQRADALPTRRALLAVGASGLVLGTIVPTDPNWIGVVLAVGLILAIYLATWRRPRIVAVVGLVIIAIGALWWSQRMTSHLWKRMRTIEGFSFRDDLLAPVVLGAALVLCVMLLHTVRRLSARIADRVS